ncbi:rRNA pseudouridine synthase [Acidaminobacter sp. JC074]|uniref:pseudouridine synthase n=1 Tax=Acidaminobacter sp. JC074 TaxID=2530199 RepID=UPI001F0E046B|nr:pseudouridine synthase [Acidaminobacter sp. JC074]MCH4890387.1 rRNA pseudouridine synthase [Acidaminobacter sp. JC074]
MRLDKFLSNMGKGSRTDVKKMITKGLVSVDGDIIRKVGFNVDPDKNEICVNGELISFEKHVYLIMNKPKDVISARQDKVHKTVIDLLNGYGNRKLFPVGRLDIDTEGMLLITDDGQWNHDLMNPKKHVSKIYYAHIEGRVDEEDVKAFSEGLILKDDSLCKPADLKILSSGEISKIELTISEGKYHQVKRMFASRGKRVLYLKRIQIGGLRLDDSLELGEFRDLTSEEMKKIKLEA